MPAWVPEEPAAAAPPAMAIRISEGVPDRPVAGWLVALERLKRELEAPAAVLGPARLRRSRKSMESFTAN